MNTHEMDQMLAQIKEELPKMYWAIYTGCIDEGFTEVQALQIVLATVGGK